MKTRAPGRCIIATWHDQNNRQECYSTIRSFMRRNPVGFNYHTIDSYIVKRKIAYVSERVTLKRVELIK